MITLIIIFSIIYCLTVLAIAVLFIKARSVQSLSKPYSISIVIAARNEAGRISSCLESMVKIDYPHEKHEVIWVDDASSDETALLIEKYVSKKSNWHLLQVTEKKRPMSGKKSALQKGIAAAKGDIIFTTDADCTVPKNWLTQMSSLFDQETDMVLGHSILQRRKGWIDKLLRFDNLFSGIMIAAPALLGFPMSSVGRNMAYRKSTFEKLGGYRSLKHHKSGDDIHLTELFRHAALGKIKFCFDKDTFTISKSPDTTGEILHQQIRKNSKLLKKSPGSIALTTFLLAYHSLLVVFPVFYGLTTLWILLIAVKLFSEFITLTVSAARFSEIQLMGWFPLFQICYPLYVILLAIPGIFQLYQWKK